MERAREHAGAAGATGSTAQKNATEGGDGDENLFAESAGGDEEGGDEGGRAGAGAGPEAVSVSVSGSGSMVVAEGIRSLIRATWEDVKDWCDEEAEARVRRKDAQVGQSIKVVQVVVPFASGVLSSHPCLFRLFFYLRVFYIA